MHESYVKTYDKITKELKNILDHLAKKLATSVLCDRGHANGPEHDVLKNVVCKNEHGAKARTPLCNKKCLRAKRICVAGY